MGFAMHAHVSHLVEPLTHSGVERVQAGELQASQEVFLEVTNGILDAPFGVGRELHPMRLTPNSSSPSSTLSTRGAVSALS